MVAFGGIMGTSAEIKLLVDKNVKGLARWLRFLGLDTLIAGEGESDSTLAEQVIYENRILITRDRKLAEKLPKWKCIFLDSDLIPIQIERVLQIIGMTEKETWFHRCTSDNEILRELSEERLQDDPRIPSFIKDSKNSEIHRAWICDGCCLVYWRGSHYDRAKSHLERLSNL